MWRHSSGANIQSNSKRSERRNDEPPTQIQFAISSGRLGNFKFEWPILFFDKRVDLESSIRNEPQLALWIAGVDYADLIAGLSIQVGIMHPERCVVIGLR